MSDDTAVAAASPYGLQLYSPTIFTPNSPQIQQSEPVATSGEGGGGTSTGGGGTGSSSSDAAQALRFTATCAASDSVGNAVRMNGSANAVVSVTNAQPYPTVGIIVAKSSGTSCTVQTYGLATGAVSGLTALQRYFVGPGGALVTSGQVFSAGQYVQLVGFAVTADTLFIQPSGTIGQLAASVNANGDDATPQPSSDGQQLLYGGVLYGNTEPASDLGRKGDSYFYYAPDGGVLLYGAKASDTDWGTPRSLRGEAGNQIYIRETAPDGSVSPKAGDLWLDKIAYNLYPAE